MNDHTLPLGGLSSVGGKAVVSRFDGGLLSSNSGVLALAEVEKRLRVAERLARCIDDPPPPAPPGAGAPDRLADWPDIRILLCGDSHHCSPRVIDWCRANDVDFILGLAPTTTLRKHVADLILQLY